MIVDLMRVPSADLEWVREWALRLWGDGTGIPLRIPNRETVCRLGRFHDAVNDRLKMDPMARSREVLWLGVSARRVGDALEMAIAVTLHGPWTRNDPDTYGPPDVPPNIPKWLADLAYEIGVHPASFELTWHDPAENSSRWMVKYMMWR